MVEKTWTEKEKQFLTENYGKIPDWKLLKHLEKTVHGICNMVGRLELKKPSNEWSDDELKILIRWYGKGKQPIEKLSKKLNRTPKAIYDKAFAIGLKKKRKINERN